MKIDLNNLSKRRKIILTITGIIYELILFMMIAYGFKLAELAGVTLFAVIFIGVIFLWIE